MERRIHEGTLYQDKHKRYCLYEPGVPEHKTLTCTSGCRLEVWLNRAWIAGHVEGDGEDYWLFADTGLPLRKKPDSRKVDKRGTVFGGTLPLQIAFHRVQPNCAENCSYRSSFPRRSGGYRHS